MSSPYRADHVGSFLRPADCWKRAARKRPLRNLQAIEDSPYSSRSQPPEGDWPRCFHRWRIAAHQLHERLHRCGGRLRFRRRGFAQLVRRYAQRAPEQQAAVSSINGIVTSPLRQRQPLTGTRTAVPAQACSRADQDHAAQRNAVSCHLVQVRHYRLRLRRSVRAAHCGHGDHGRGHSDAGGQRHLLSADRCAAVQLLP